MPTPRFRLQDSAVLLVDVQEKLLPHMDQAPRLLAQCDRLLDGAAALDLPLLVTEQYRKGLGPTVDALQRHLPRALCNEEKLKFSACVDGVRRHLAATQTRAVLVCGIEAHVCVLQTCLDLADAGYTVGLVTDAVSSRRPDDCAAAQSRMIQAGIVPTTVETALLELVHEAGGDKFKSILPLIK